MINAKLTSALVIAAAAWPAGAYAIPDAYVPTGPEPTPAVTAPAPQDLRSPDARDAGPAPEASPARDLRSPDARDAAREAGLAPAESARVSAGRSAPSVSDGFEWGDAGIGAAVMLALVSVASGTLVLVSRSRHRTPTT